MIALVLLFQVALADPGVLTVQGPAHRVSVTLVQTPGGPLLAPHQLDPAVPTELGRSATGRYLLRIGGVPFELADQLPFVRIGDDIVPLVAAPAVRGGELFVPLQLVAEIYPRHAGNATFDADRMELLVRGPAAAAVAESVSRPSTPAAGVAQTRPRKRTVVIDAGHGGRDAGTSGRARSGRMIVEKDVALAVAHQVAKELRERDIDVVMTRSADVFVELPERGRIANARRGDIFISIHVNASAPRARNGSAARGVETYFLAVAKTEDAQRVADMENASIRFETQSEVAKDDPLAFIINDMAENEHLRESSDLASVIQRRLSARHPGPVGDRGVKQGPFRVLVTSYMPAVLVELGFATNADDAAYLLDPAHQKAMAEAIAAAAVDYFEDYERRVGSGSTNR
jgi:N-acetylmuramoyl-L-alanine amidase